MMLDAPRTLVEARAHRYGQWNGNERGNRYIEDRCAYEVFATGRFITHQCSRPNGHGPAKLYCRQHVRRASR